MDLIDCASFFDDTSVTAPGSSVELFVGQLELFDNQMRDGLQTERRILSYDPRQVFTLPADGIVSFAGRNWALGLTSPDTFQSDNIRAAYVAHMLDSQITLGSAGDFLAGAPSAPVWAGVVWTKDSKDGNGTEEVWSQVTLYTGSGVQADDGEFALAQGKMWRIRSAHFVASGVTALDAIELPSDTSKTIQWVSAAGYDKIKQKPVPGATVDVPALVMRFYHDYRLVTQAAITPKDGDLVARVPQSVGEIKAGDTAVVDGVNLSVVSVRTFADATYWLHLAV
jgi:hypothetical protein